MKRFAFYFMILLSCIQSCTAGFIAGTLVKTPNGHIPIEQLEVNDLIICYDYQNSFTTRSISHIKKQTTTAYLCIVCESKPLYTSSDHLFYLPQQNIWVPAHLLKSNDILLKNFTEHTAIQYIYSIPDKQDIYDITIADYHNFCVSTLNITVHNFLPVIALGISFLFGGGISFNAISIAATIAGVGVAISLKKGKNHLPKTTINIISSESCNNAGGPEEDPEKKRRCNTMHKSEFFNKIKDNYEHYKNGIYRRKKGTKGIANAEYLEWDHLHNDVEAFGKNKWHLGSVDAKTLRLYRSAIKGRCLTI